MSRNFLDPSHQHHALIKEKLQGIMDKFVRDQELTGTFELSRLSVEILRPRILKDRTTVSDYEVSGYFLYKEVMVRFEVKAHYTHGLGLWIETFLYLKCSTTWNGHVYPFRNRHSPSNWGLGSWDNESDEVVYQQRNEFIHFDDIVRALSTMHFVE